MTVAEQLLELRWKHTRGHTLRYWRSSWMSWRGPHWDMTPEAEVFDQVALALYGAQYIKLITRGNKVEEKLVDWDPTKSRVSDVMMGLRALSRIPDQVQPQHWLTERDNLPDPSQMISCSNGLLDIVTRKLYPHTPNLLNLSSVPFEYDERAETPETWLSFLKSIWSADIESIGTLQEWFGYVLSGSTRHQKMLVVIGPPGSGKGTIANVLRDLVTPSAYAGPTASSLTGMFGLQGLIGKSLAVIPDMRADNKVGQSVVERLLVLVGDDTLSIDRKFQAPWTGQLPARLMALTNQVPNLRDASGALADRMLLLIMTKGFRGTDQQDKGLSKKLAKEMPGILNWALDGLDRLDRRDKFIEPAASAESRQEVEEVLSPIGQFVEQCCKIGPEYEVEIQALYRAWCSWCDQTGHQAGSSDSMGMMLRSLVGRGSREGGLTELRRIRKRFGERRQNWYRGLAPMTVQDDPYGP